MDEIALAAYWQLGKPMFKEVMKEVCHEGTCGFYRKPDFENVTNRRSNKDGAPINQSIRPRRPAASTLLALVKIRSFVRLATSPF